MNTQHHQTASKNDLYIYKDQKIGRGGFGEVYRGLLVYPDKRKIQVAVKIVDLESETQRKLAEGELNILRKNQNIAGIVRFYDYLKSVSKFMFVLKEYKQSLSSFLSQHKGKLTKKIILRIIIFILEAVIQLHKNHAMHRDLKEQNMLVDYSDYKSFSDITVCLTDFGLSKNIKKDQIQSTESKQIAGSPQYLAPEVVQFSDSNHLDRQKIDAWALGVVFYKILKEEKFINFDDNVPEEYSRLQTDHRNQVKKVKRNFFRRSQMESLMKKWQMDEKEAKFLKILLSILLDEHIESRYSVIDLQERGQKSFLKLMKEIRQIYGRERTKGKCIFWSESNTMSYEQYKKIIQKVYR